MKFLDPDRRHPPRPDWPVFRHLTFTEVHAMELGLYFGLFIVWSMVLGTQQMAFGLAAVVARKIVSHRRKKGTSTECDHDVGFHDVVDEPHYFGVPVVVVVAVYLLSQLV